MKVAINRCLGGFCLSKAAYEELGIEWDGYGFKFDDDRTNPMLIEVIEKLGSEAASGSYAELKIIEIPDDIGWIIEGYDGREWISEIHRTWK